MGMSASQARLLSITTRLTNNEFRAQTITNSKLRLAEKSEEASAEYMDALNSQTLNFRYYDSNGDAQTYKLTPAFLYSYEALKSQYAIQNTSGQYLVSKVDADNFKTSENLYTFLGKYGLTDDSEWTNYQTKKTTYDDALKKYNEDLGTYNHEDQVKLRNEYAKYIKDLDKYNKDYAEWQEKYSLYQAELKLYDDVMKDWGENHTDKDLAQEFINIVGTSDSPNSCYQAALVSGRGECYLHVLDYLLDYDGSGTPTCGGNYKTTTGDEFTTAHTSATLDSSTNEEQKKSFGEISKILNLNIKCDGDDNLTENERKGTPGETDKKENSLESEDYKNLLEKLKDESLSETEKEKTEKAIKFMKLKSDYKEDGTIKTLKQKAIDMYYLISHKDDYDDIDTDMMKSMLVNFTEGDMKCVSERPEKPIEPQPPTKPEWTGAKPIDKPVKPEEPVQPACEMNLIDGDKAQWYVNLWHLMNGSSTANVVRKRQSTEDDEFGVTAGKDFYQIEDCDRNASAELNYKVMDDKDSALWTSPEWLQFALENGIVTLVKAQYYNPSDNGGKILDNDREGISWNSIIYTNAPDLSYTDNETAIAIAEVKYKNAVSEIETKDKKYDQDLKKLDTEHTALQTEYDSIKGVIDKNVERSFKAFS